MTKAEMHAYDRCKALVPLILELSSLEMKKESFARRKRLDKLYNYLCVNAYKLGIKADNPSRYYNPQDYSMFAKKVKNILEETKEA